MFVGFVGPAETAVVLGGVAAVLIGYLAGASWESVAGTVGTTGAVVAAAVVVVVLVVWRVHRHRSSPAAA